MAAANPVRMPRENDQQEYPHDMDFKYLNQALLSTIAIKYQGKAVDLFETHPTMWIFFGSTCINYLFTRRIRGVNDQPEGYYRVLNNIAQIAGALSSVALASILLPRILGWLLFVMWVVHATVIARHFFVYLCVLVIPSHIREWINDKSTCIGQWFQRLPILPK